MSPRDQRCALGHRRDRRGDQFLSGRGIIRHGTVVVVDGGVSAGRDAVRAAAEANGRSPRGVFQRYGQCSFLCVLFLRCEGIRCVTENSIGDRAGRR